MTHNGAEFELVRPAAARGSSQADAPPPVRPSVILPTAVVVGGGGGATLREMVPVTARLTTGDQTATTGRQWAWRWRLLSVPPLPPPPRPRQTASRRRSGREMTPIGISFRTPNDANICQRCHQCDIEWQRQVLWPIVGRVEYELICYHRYQLKCFFFAMPRCTH